MAGTARARQARARDAAEKGLLLSRVRVAARGCAGQGGATRGYSDRVLVCVIGCERESRHSRTQKSF